MTAAAPAAARPVPPRPRPGRRVHVLEREQVIPAPLDRVFAFFSRARNLERITPPWLSFRVETPGEPVMAVGTVLDYRITVKGLPARWRSLIAAWDPPHAFEDVMLAGPYRSWEHRHEFEAVPGGTRMRDVVRWSLPLGALGNLAAPFVRRDLDRIFAFRRETVERELG